MLVNKKVTYTFNGKIYNLVTNSRGQVTITVSKLLVPNKYVASITFAGDDTYLKSSLNVNITVSKAPSKIIASAKIFKSTVKTKAYSIVLRNYLNKAIGNAVVSLKVNGKNYYAKTNAKGQAVFKITKLTKKGKFYGLIVFKGNKYNKNVARKVIITVK